MDEMYGIYNMSVKPATSTKQKYRVRNPTKGERAPKKANTFN